MKTNKHNHDAPPPAPDAFLWLDGHEDETEANCGCKLTREFADSGCPAVELCPLHAAAERMLLALNLMVNGDGQPNECPRAMKACRDALRAAGKVVRP